MQAFGGHVSENLGVDRAPIETREAGLYHTVTIGAAVDFEIEDVVSFGVETGEPARLSGIFHPAGCELTVAKATRSSITRSGSGTRGRPPSPLRTSPGQRDVSAAGTPLAADDGIAGRRGLGPAFAPPVAGSG